MDVLLLVAALALPNLLVPVLYRIFQRQSVPRLRPVAPGQAPPSVARAVAHWEQALEGRMTLAGVHQVLASTWLTSPPRFSTRDPRLAPGVHPDHVAGHVVHFVDRAAGVHGLLYLTPWRRWQSFLTRYDDGTAVVTVHSDVDASVAEPGVHRVRFAWIRGPDRLRELHDVHVRRVMGARAPAPVPRGGALTGFVAEWEAASLERQRELGRATRHGDVYRPTWKGALVVAANFFLPLFAFNRWRNARRATALVRAAGRRG